MSGKSSLLEWKREFLIDIEPLDRQHRDIFECLLAIENAMVKRDPWHIVEWFIANLEITIATHIVAEETLLEIFGYPCIDHHRTQHGRLKAGIRELERSIQQTMSPETLVPYFEQWFVYHVLSEDKEYVGYLKPFISAPEA